MIELTDAMATAMYEAKDLWPNYQCDNRRELAWSFAKPRWDAAIAAAPKSTPPEPVQDGRDAEIERLKAELESARKECERRALGQDAMAEGILKREASLSEAVEVIEWLVPWAADHPGKSLAADARLDTIRTFIERHKGE